VTDQGVLLLPSRLGSNGTLTRIFLFTRRGSGLSEPRALLAASKLSLVEFVICVTGRNVGDNCISVKSESLRDAGRRGRLGGDADLSEREEIIIGCG
jgi:hypothetical protein